VPERRRSIFSRGRMKRDCAALVGELYPKQFRLPSQTLLRQLLSATRCMIAGTGGEREDGQCWILGSPARGSRPRRSRRASEPPSTRCEDQVLSLQDHCPFVRCRIHGSHYPAAAAARQSTSASRQPHRQAPRRAETWSLATNRSVWP